MCDMFPQVEETINEEIPPELISLGSLNNSIRPMKWFIFNADKSSEAYGCPLCWDELAIEFNSKAAAKRFIWSLYNEDITVGLYEIQNKILYYDNGYINLSNYVVTKNGDTEELLEVGPVDS